jgi:hypothetical protein
LSIALPKGNTTLGDVNRKIAMSCDHLMGGAIYICLFEHEKYLHLAGCAMLQSRVMVEKTLTRKSRLPPTVPRTGTAIDYVHIEIWCETCKKAVLHPLWEFIRKDSKGTPNPPACRRCRTLFNTSDERVRETLNAAHNLYGKFKIK